MKRPSWLLSLVGLAFLGCNETTIVGILPPTNLFYVLEASGDPAAPSAVLLEWDPVDDPDLQVYNVYSSPDGSNYDLRGSTTSSTFHDAGPYDPYYFVTAVDLQGGESGASNEVVIDEALRLEKPASITSVSLNGAIHLAWADNAFLNEPGGFRRYRVYSASYTIGDPECGADWSLEGTTVSPEFIVAALTNGFSRCFGVSAESIEGWESVWSDIRQDTPRPDARNVLAFTTAADLVRSGFSFFLDSNGDFLVSPTELGLVLPGNRTDIDFRVIDISGVLYLEPIRSGTGVELYANVPVADLTSIDLAPNLTFGTTAIQATTGFGYVFEMDGGDGFARYGGLRVTHVGADYLIFDWSYQTDPGNPELRVRGRG